MSGSYLGGGTVISPWKRRKPEEGWEPARKPISGKPQKKKLVSVRKGGFCEYLGRNATAFEIAVVEFSREWADATLLGKPMPAVPSEIKERYSENNLRKYLKLLKGGRIFKDAMATLGKVR